MTGTLKKNTPTGDTGKYAETIEKGTKMSDNALSGDAHADGTGAGDAGNTAPNDRKYPLVDGTTTTAVITDL